MNEHHDGNRFPALIEARILGAALLPLLALGVIAVAGIGDRTVPGRCALGTAAGLIALVAPLLLASMARGDRSGSAAERSARRAGGVLAGLCVFVLGASLGISNLLPRGGAEEGRFWTTNRQPPANLTRPLPSSMPPRPVSSEGPAGPGEAERLLARGAELLRQGKLQPARDAYRDGLVAARDNSQVNLALKLSVGLAESCLELGDPVSAKKAAEDGLAMSGRSTKRRGGVPAEEVVRLLVVKGLALAAVDDTEAVPALEEALALCDEHHGRNMALREDVVKRLVDLLRTRGENDALLAMVDAHLEHLERAEHRDPLAMAEWHEEAGRLLGATGRFDESATHFEKAVALREEGAAADPLKAAFSRVNLARSLIRAGHAGRAREALTAARKVLAERLPPEHDARLAAEALSRELGDQRPK
ncbi:MAG TPA: tetratricopeptide repeat protein [Polyangia bacterium]|nr:tetratricopeptide repeat protein [Polyangia bacterium]